MALLKIHMERLCGFVAYVFYGLLHITVCMYSHYSGNHTLSTLCSHIPLQDLGELQIGAADQARAQAACGRAALTAMLLF